MMKNRWIIILIVATFSITNYSCNTSVEGQSASIDKNINTANNNVTFDNAGEKQSVKKESTAMPIHLTSETFKEKVFNYEINNEWKYNGNLPCIIDFYADWCGPCKRIAPVLEDLAKEYDGKIIIYKVNTEQERELASVFGITSIPTLLFVPVKDQPQIAQGALPKETFKEVIDNVLLKKSN